MVLVWFYKILGMIAIWAIQVLVFNQIHILGCITPLISVYILSLFPKNTPRSALLVWAFAFGILIDLFSGTPGVVSASMTLAAFFQPLLLKLFVSKDDPEDLTPSIRSMGKWKYFQYLLLITMLHHISFFLLEAFSFFNWETLLTSMGGSIALSLLIMMILEFVRNPKKQKN